MTSRPGTRKLLDDCFLHDKDRMRHEEVVALLLQRLHCVTDTESVSLAEAHGRVAAADINAPRPVPLHNNAAVDGYAFSHASYVENEGRFKLTERLAAGDSRNVTITPGNCARIFTGAAMPQGTDTVAMQEDCVVDSNGVSIPVGLKPGANCRNAGEDLGIGEVVVKAGDCLRPQDIAALASLGLAKVDVRERLRVATISTGNELVEPGGTISYGQVYDSNSPMLRTLIESAGGTVTAYGIQPDNAPAIEAALAKAAASHDLVITSGGASRGEEDHMLGALDRLGKRHLWQIAVKPGRPMMLGQIGDSVVVGLPGNPVAAFVCFLLYVRTAMRALNGATYREPVRYSLPADFDIARKKAERREFLRGFLAHNPTSGALSVQKYPRDGSGLISGLRAADGLIELDESVLSVAAGDTVSFIPFNEFGL
jgi:molybdopterin molybdotransferase